MRCGPLYQPQPALPAPEAHPPNDGIIISLIPENQEACPTCELTLIPQDRQKRRCLGCHTYFAYIGESLLDVVAVRAEAHAFPYDLDPDHATQSIYMWDGATDTYYKVFEPPLQEVQ